MITTKETEFIHPIWWRDITKEFLGTKELGKFVLELQSIEPEEKVSHQKSFLDRPGARYTRKDWLSCFQKEANAWIW